jgi:hypothetical protein
MCETTYYLLWNDGNSVLWLPALSLPILPEVQPLLPHMGLSSQLLDHLSQWQPIYESAIAKRNRRSELECPLPNYRGEPIREIILQALQQFADQTDRPIAVELDRWVRRHVFCESLGRSLRGWQRILLEATRYHPSSPKAVRCPDSLETLLPQIETWLTTDFSSALRKVLPNPDNLDQSFAKQCLGEILERSVIIQSLCYIAQSLTAREIQQLVGWSRLQAIVLQTDVIDLQGDRLLQATLPCSNVPSILDLPHLG